MQKAQASDKVWLIGEGTFYFLAKDWFLWNNRSTRGTLSWSCHLKWTVLIDINAETRQFLPTTLCFLVKFFCQCVLLCCLEFFVCLFCFCLHFFYLRLFCSGLNSPYQQCRVCVAVRSTTASPCHGPRHPWPKNLCLELIFARLV